MMKIENRHKTYGGETRFYVHDSIVTKTQMRFSVFIPEAPVTSAIVWLSGLTCTEENFIAKSGVQQLLAETSTMVICPDTSPRGVGAPDEDDSYDFGVGAGFYVNATTENYQENYQMYDYVNEEIMTILAEEFGIAADKISLTGHSMGGHGALIIGLRNPEKFQSVSAFAPIVHPSACPWGKKAFAGYLGDDTSAWADYDACSLLASGHMHPTSLLIDQGTADEFLTEQLLSDDLIQAAQKAGQGIEFTLREGYDHSFYFIATYLKEHMDFHLNHLTM